MLQTEASCPSARLSRGHLVRSTGHAEASHFVFVVYDPFRDFREVHSRPAAFE